MSILFTAKYRLIFPLGLFVSACLLFVIQPMAAKLLLPIYGGSPQVWTICLLFFQGILLLAYAYVYLLSHISNASLWRNLHCLLCLISLLGFPFMCFPVESINQSPESHILLQLTKSFGLPLFIISTSAPLLQMVFSQSTHHTHRDPYFLYIASNVGSLLALAAYPYFIEHLWGVQQQLRLWSNIYLCYLLILFGLLLGTRPPSSHMKRMSQTQRSLPYGYWIFQSFVACGLMLAVTFYISTDIAATPLFWVIPLALYLLTFILAFRNRQPEKAGMTVSYLAQKRVVKACLLLPTAGFFIHQQPWSVYLLIMANLGSFFMLALACHNELVRTRPDSCHLTFFYLCLATGGVLAGLFNGLIAPRIFSHADEYPLFLILAALGFTLPWKQYKKAGILLGILLCSLWYTHIQTSAHAIAQQRNFYGIKQVLSQHGAHILVSQNTAHGFQIPGIVDESTGAQAYYGTTLPVIRALQTSQPVLHAAILGLGTGIMACQFRQQDKLEIVEIDEQVIAMANNPQYFTFLRDCPPDVALIKNDALIAAKTFSNHQLDVLVVDAFLSDAIPTHLLTLEAFRLYQQKIKNKGSILVNITNRHLHILPVLTGAGRALDMIVLHKETPLNAQLGQLAAEWVLLTKNESLANHLMSHEHWQFVTADKAEVWTNDYSSIVHLLKWS